MINKMEIFIIIIYFYSKTFLILYVYMLLVHKLLNHLLFMHIFILIVIKKK